MMIDTTIARWVDTVPSRQWARENATLATIGAALPEIIACSPPLSAVHRLDLSLFVIFEEAALPVSGALTRSAPTIETLNFAAQQTLDEARHHEMFLRRLVVSCQAVGMEKPGINEAIMTPPLRRFLARCNEVVDRGDFVEGLTLMNLVFEGMAYPLYTYEQRYWHPVDPYLASLVRSAFTDESRHVTYGAQLVKDILQGDAGHRAKVTQLCREAILAIDEVFAYYIRKFVKLFDAVARLHKSVFADAEFAPGRPISATPYQEQIQAIHASIDEQHARIIARAGLS